MKNNPKVRLEVLPQEEFNMQQVDQTTLMFVLKGSVELLIEGQIIQVASNELSIINAGQMVAFIGKKNNLVLLVTLDMRQQLFPGEVIWLNQPLSAFYYQELYEEMTQLLALLYIETVEKPKGHEAFITSYLAQLKGLILRFLPLEMRQVTAEKQSINEKTPDIMHYLNQHYQEEITLDFLAERFFLSKFYLAHSFKKQVGMSMGQYLKEVRLLNAVKLLSQHHYGITQIAHSTGFSSPRAFVEAFKQKNGVSPTQYRKKQQADSAMQLAEPVSQNYQELLSPFIKARQSEYYARMDIVEKTIQTNQAPVSLSHYDYVLKMYPENLKNYLEQFATKLRPHFVAVDQLMDKLVFHKGNQGTTIDFSPLEKELRLLVSYRMKPYLQLSVYDFEVYQLQQLELSFSQVMSQLNYFIESTFSHLTEWRLEFRPYYEFDGTGELCEPLKDVISLFQTMCPLIIHLPKHPLVTQTSSGRQVAVIDDRTRVASYPLDVVLEQLSHQRYIELIQENQNMLYQRRLLERLTELGNDPYYQQFNDLIYANLMMWMLFYSLDVSQQTIIQPLSLDGKPIFLYFEEALSQKLAMVSPQGLYSDVWYSFLFLEKLYEEIIYKNDYCLVTRRGEHYRIFLIHSDNFIDHLAQLREKKAATKNYQQPTVFVKLTLTGLKGTYRLTKQELTPSLKLSQKKALNISADVNLLPEDIVYINQIQQPTRQIEEVRIVDGYTIEEEIPLLGMKFIELTKIK